MEMAEAAIVVVLIVLLGVGLYHLPRLIIAGVHDLLWLVGHVFYRMFKFFKGRSVG